MKTYYKKSLIYFSFFLLTISYEAKAYPDFIGYGYSTCITCHYNGHGGGALNDYGRALYATEITARDVYPKTMDEEEIAAQSGFLWKKTLPWWVRPGIKYRGLWLKENPGGDHSEEEFVNMQTEVNLNFFFDKKQTLSLITTESYTANEDYYGKTNTWFFKEYFLLWKQSNNFWLYLGQLDKVYGIRNVDHTSVNRSPITLGQFDQSLGVVTHFTYPSWDIAANVFLGNAEQEESTKQKGFSISGEKQVFENFKIGGSYLNSKSDTTRWNLLAFMTRLGLSKGSAIMAELGLKEQKNLVADTEPQLGTYALIETLVNVRRGYNILSMVEHTKSDIKHASTEFTRWSFGALLFPLPRLEIRLMGVNGKVYAENSGTEDSWSLQAQGHISY